MRYLGVDLHSNNFMVCDLSENEEPSFKQYQLSELEAFKDFLYLEDRIAVEATNTTRFFYNQVAALVTDEDKLASYFGIVPRVSNSNQTQHHGSITKRGSKLARTVLVQCTLTAKRFSPCLKQYYERIKVRRGSSKAIIATARKFLGIIYRTLKYKWVFSDFPNFVLAEQ